MASIADTRVEIRDAVAALPLRCFEYSPPNLPMPCAIVGFPSRYLPNDTLDDTASFTIPVSVYVPYTSNRSAEDNLQALLDTSGASSLIATIEAIGSNYAVSSVRDFGVLENSDGQPYALGCVIDVEVLA